MTTVCSRACCSRACCQQLILLELSDMNSGACVESVPVPVGSAYCVSEATRFVIDQNAQCSGYRNTLRDAQGNIVFRENKRTIRNASDEHVASVKRQRSWMEAWIIPAIFHRHKWNAYRGEDLLFTMVPSAIFQCCASYDIFLPENKSSNPDFTVKGDPSKHYLNVYYGEVTIAVVQRKDTKFGKSQYDTSIRPGIDYAFILLVVVIIQKLREAMTKAVRGVFHVGDNCGNCTGG